jgi:CubicO group peptidase (beta-lactamase class C family)
VHTIRPLSLPGALCLLLVPFFGSAVLGAQEAGRPQDLIRATRVDSIFQAFDNTRSPGCAVGILEGGELAFARGFGMANLDLGLAITPRSIFRTGSVSKQFTAAVVVLLAREGAFSLDDPIRTYLPELAALYQPITLRHLLHHTSGIRDYLELMEMKGVGDEATYTEEDVVELLARQEGLNFLPGTAFRYSNSGYALLSRIVDRATGYTLREQAQRLLFGPLGMTHTHFHDDHREIVPLRATGYNSAADGHFFVDQTTLDIVGDGGVFTSVEDMARWMANFWVLKIGGPEWLAAMENPGVLSSGDTLDYALGLTLGEQRGLVTVGHGGSFVGYRAATLRYPTEGVGVMILCNYARVNPTALAEGVGAVWLEDRMEPPAPPPPARQEAEAPRAPQERPLPMSRELEAALVGTYYSRELDATYRIVREGDNLVLDMNGVSMVPMTGGPEGTVRADWLTLTYHMEGPTVNGFQAGSGRAGGIEFRRITPSGRDPVVGLDDEDVVRPGMEHGLLVPPEVEVAHSLGVVRAVLLPGQVEG